MPYGFNDDKSKFSLTSLINSVGNAVSNLANLTLSVGNLRTDVDGLSGDVDNLSDDVGELSQQMESKVSLGDIKVIQGTVASVPSQQSQMKSYTAAQLNDLGISNIDNYIVISCMNQNSSFGSWVTGAGNHDNYGYANPYIVEIGSTKPYPLQIQAYNLGINAMDIIYRIVLMKVA